MHVVLNMACSVDGRVAGPGGDPVRLSNVEDTRRVHRLRADSDAVCIGIGTVLSDDPRLTAREGLDPEDVLQPTRVVFDSHLETPSEARVLDDRAETIVLTLANGAASLGGAKVLSVSGSDRVDVNEAARELAERGIDQLLVEGGPTLAASFLDAGLVDRFSLYVAPRILGGGPLLGEGLENVEVELVPRSRGPLGEGTLVHYGVQA